MPLKFEDIDVERAIIAYGLKGPEGWKELPEAWFKDPLALKAYQAIKQFHQPPYSMFPSLDIVVGHIEDLDTKLFIQELSPLIPNLIQRDLPAYVHTMYEMYAARSIYDISRSIPNDLERKKVSEIIKDKIQILTGLVNPLDVGQRERGTIYETAKTRWERFKAIEINPNLANKIPFGIDEFDDLTGGGLGESHMLLLFAETGGFKCLSFSSRLTDIYTGIQHCVGDIVKNKQHINLQGLNVDSLKKVEVSPDDFAESGMQEVFEVELQSGRKITGPAHHPLYTQDLKWEKISDLEVGNCMLATPRKLDFPKYSISIPKHKTSMLGHMISKGCFIDMSFTNTDRSILSNFYEHLSKFNDNVYHISKDTHHLIGRDNYIDVDPETFEHNNGVNYRGSNLLNWFREINLDITTTNYKSIPDIIFQADSVSLIDFIAKLWSGGGIVADCGKLTYIIESERLAEQLQHLLLRLGIQSNNHTIMNTKSISHVIGITGASAILFHKIIGIQLVGDKKEKSRIKLTEMILAEHNQNNDIIPYSTLIKVMGHSLFVKTFQGGQKYKTQGISRRSLLRKLSNINHVHYTELLRLVTADIYWDRVISIESKGMQETFDMEIPIHKNYIANDIYVHNSKTKANLAYNMAFQSRKRVMVMTLEIPMHDYGTIIDSRHAGVDFTNIMNGKLLKHDKDKLRYSMIDMDNEKYPFYIVDIPDRATSADIIKELELYKSEYGDYPEVLFIDYANEMDPTTPWGNTSEKFKNLGVEFRRISRTYGVRIVTSMQMNREGKKAKEPGSIGLEHMSESHYFANVFHLVVHLYQDPSGIEEIENILNWSIKKNRYGRKDVTFQTFANPSLNYIGDRKIRMVV